MKEEQCRAEIARLTDAYATATELEQSTVLARALKDARFLERTAAGKTFTLRVYDRALRWFSSNWPNGVAWPEGIERPAPEDAEAVS